MVIKEAVFGAVLLVLFSFRVLAVSDSVEEKIAGVQLTSDDMSAILSVPDHKEYWYFKPDESLDERKAAIVNLYNNRGLTLDEASDALSELVATEGHLNEFSARIDEVLGSLMDVNDDHSRALLCRFDFLRSNLSLINQTIVDMYLGCDSVFSRMDGEVVEGGKREEIVITTDMLSERPQALSKSDSANRTKVNNVHSVTTKRSSATASATVRPSASRNAYKVSSKRPEPSSSSKEDSLKKGSARSDAKSRESKSFKPTPYAEMKSRNK